MSGNCDRRLPVLYQRLDSLYDNRRTEHRSVQDRADRSVRALPHLRQVILLHTGRIRRNRRTLYGNSILSGGHSRINRYLILCLFPVLKAKIIIF